MLEKLSSATAAMTGAHSVAIKVASTVSFPGALFFATSFFIENPEVRGKENGIVRTTRQNASKH